MQRHKEFVRPFCASAVVFLALITLCQPAFSQEVSHRDLRTTSDTTRLTTVPKDSLRHVTAVHDTTKFGRLVNPVFKSGAVTYEPTCTISDSEILWSDYTYSGEVLKKIPGSFLADMAQPGAPSELYFDGLGSDYTKYLLDGVELNDPTTSSINLYHVPMEFVNNVEYIDALRAPIYQFNATGGLIDFQSPLYSESQPYSKIRHIEGPYNYLITDGVFSQNVGFKSNIDFGFERQTTDQRFQNSLYDGVNIRAKYRYSIDSTQQIMATELYYRTKGGANGGSLPYDVNSLIFDQGQDPIRSYTADLTYLQHHLQVAYSKSDPNDSSRFYTLSAFFDYYNFQYGELANQNADTSFYLTNISQRIGANLRGSERFLDGTLNFGAEAVREENPYNSYTLIQSTNRISGYADEEIYLFDFLKTGIFGRGDMVAGEFYPAYGASFGIGNEMFELEAGGNVSDHVPSMSEKYFVTQNFIGNPNLGAETDRTLQITAKIRLGDDLDFSFKPYIKLIDNPIYFETRYNGKPEYPQIADTNLSTEKIYGLDASMEITLWKFGADGNFNFVNENIDGSQARTLPEYFASGELYFHDILFTGHLNLRFGVRGQVESSFEGSEFYPAALVYYPASLNSLGPFGSSDFFLQCKVGDAVIYFTLFNLTNQEYAMAPIYPALGTSFSFGINWEFLN
ncbi:MAG: TonB-dependent receptor plug domain-containing protein [Candidatus Kryptoniota bacterium]